MSTWKGVSHGRTTRAMERSLLPAEFKVIATVRRLIPDGARRKLSNAEIAAKAKVSEGTVSRTMRKVDGIFVRRHFVGRGRGNGYEIEVIPPPEQLQLPLPAPEKGSLTDPSLESFLSGVPTPETPPEKGSLTDPSIFLDHAHEQQQQPGGPSTQPDRGQTGPAGQLAPETIAALTAAGAHPKLIQRVAAANPGCTPADVAAALAAAHEKPNSHTPPGLALECLASNQAVVLPRPRPEPPAEPPHRQRGRAVPPHDAPATGAELRAQLERLGVAPPTRPAPRPDAPGQARASPRPDRRSGQIWQAVLGALQAQLPPGEFDTWLRGLDLASLADGVATLAAPSAEIAGAVERRYGTPIRRALGDFLGVPVQLRLVSQAAAID